LQRGSLTAIVGSNGSGKSTLMKGIVGILKPMAGSFTVAAGQKIAYLPQQSELDRAFPARVVDLVSLGLWAKRGFFGRHSREDRQRLGEALSSVGLSGFENRLIDTLSGGQLQRALFARVLVQDADLILLDEPFNAIDAKTVSDLVALIATWHGQRRTVVVVAHDLQLVQDHFPQALLLARAPVAWGNTRDVLLPENLMKARDFREPWDDSAPWCAAPDHAHDHDHHHDHDHGHPHTHGHSQGHSHGYSNEPKS
jgi:zinc/manganese transport system ATP-binding protein